MEVVYFELNNWSCGEDYPNAEPFISWMSNDFDIQFRDKKWIEENELAVVASVVDMSSNFCITAKKEWVEKNCSALLNEFKEFLRFPEEDDPEDVRGRFGWPFVLWSKDNVGLYFAEEKEDLDGYLYYSVGEKQ